MPRRYWDIVAKNMSDNKNGKKDHITVVVLQPPQRASVGNMGAPDNGRGVYTGKGPDGRIQPDRPAMIDYSDGRGRVLHEDETARPGNGGVNVTPSPLSRMYVPRTEAEQMDIKRREQAGEFEGFQTGGNYQYNSNIRPDIPTPYTAPVNVTQPRQTSPVNITQPTVPQTTDINIIRPQTTAPVTIDQPVTPQTTDINIIRPQTTAPVTIEQPAGSSGRTPQFRRPDLRADMPGAAGLVPDIEGAPVREGVPSVREAGVPGPVEGPEVVIPDDIPPEYHNYYLDQYRKLLRSTMDRQMAANLAAQKARAQRTAASPYLTEGARRAMAGEQERTAGLIASNLAAQLAEKGIGMAFEAEKLNLQREQFEFMKQKYGDDWGQRMAADINSGMTLDMLRRKYPDINITQEDYDSMKQLSPANWQQQAWLKQFNLTKEQWEQEFGFSVEQFQTQVEHWEKNFGFTKDQWQAQFDFAKQQYGDLEGQRIVMDINNGMSYDRIKEKYPNITLADYNQIRQDGPLGQVDYNKKMDALNILLQGGDIEGAEEMLGKMFPDLNVDFSKLVDEQNQESFGSAMSTISRLIASGLDWDEAITALKADGTYSRLEKMGFDEDSMMKLYNKFQLSTNPIYQLTHTLGDDILKDLFPDMSADKARSFITRVALFGGVTFNEDGTFSIDPEVFDKLTGGDGDTDYTYEDYKNDAEADGETPLSEEDWIAGGKKKYAPVGPEEISDEDWNKMSLDEQYEHFFESVPVDLTDEWNYNRWLQEGKYKSFDLWSEENLNVQKVITDYQDRISNEGWQHYDIDISTSSKTNKVYEDLLLAGRDKFMQGDVKQYSFEQLTGWDREKFHNNFRDGDVLYFDGYPNPVVVSRFGNLYGTSKQIWFIDLQTGDKVGTDFEWDEQGKIKSFKTQ